MKLTLLLSFLLLVLAAGPTQASVHDIHLHTDSTPDYVSIDDFVTTATGAWDDPEDQAIAIWRWIVRGRQQLNNTFEDGVPLWDPIQFFASYPNANCGYVSAYVTASADRMGPDWRHRYVELSDHTVSEMSWDGGATWHMFDTSMVVYARNHDGTIASCTDISQASSCELSQFWGDGAAEEGHAYVYHAAPECMTNPPAPGQAADLGFPSGYRKASDNPVPYSRTLRNGSDSYTHGLWLQEDFTHVRSGWRNRLHVHPGHEYTRYYAPLGSGGEYARLNTSGDDVNDGYFTNRIRSNGRWDVAPGFGSGDPAGGWYSLTGLVHRDDDGGVGPTLRPAAANSWTAAEVKVDAANVVTSARVYVAGQRGTGDSATLEISRDAGCTWTWMASLPSGPFAGWYDLPSTKVGGVHQLLVRVRMQPDGTRLDCGLDDLRIEALTQLNALTLPRLQRGANRVRFAAGPAQETLTLRPALHSWAQYPWSQSADSYSGLTPRDDSKSYSSAVLAPTTPGVPGQVTWRVDTPGDITGASLGGSFLTRYATADDWVTLSYSWDGQDFATVGAFDAATAPTWNATVFGETGAPPAGQRSVWLRYDLSSSQAPSSVSTGIQDALLKVHFRPHDTVFAPVEVTWCWTEHRTDGDVTRTHTRIVASDEELWDINVAGYRDPTMEWVRVRPADGASAAGYGDGQDVGPAYGLDKVKIDADWTDDVALGRSYTVSRPSAAFNPDAGGAELTDGVVIPPTDESGTSRVQGQAAYWDGDAPVAVVVDLGGPQTVAAVRVTSHQPNAQYGHAGTVAVSALDGADNPTALGVIQHDDVWSPPGDHLDWGYGRAENFPDLPAGDRLAHGFWLVLDQPVTADKLRFDMLPLAGRGLGLSEIQAFSAVTVSDWPDREVDLGAGGASPSPGPDVPTARSLTLAVAPNPANPGTHVTYELSRAAEVTLRVVDVRGRVVRTLAAGVRPAGTHRAYWDGRDDAGRAAGSGLYLVVGEWAGGRAVGRVTLVK